MFSEKFEAFARLVFERRQFQGISEAPPSADY